MGQRRNGGSAVVDVDELFVRYDLSSQESDVPVMFSDIEGGFKVGEKYGVADGVKSCNEVEENEDAKVTRRAGGHW